MALLLLLLVGRPLLKCPIAHRSILCCRKRNRSTILILLLSRGGEDTVSAHEVCVAPPEGHRLRIDAENAGDRRSEDARVGYAKVRGD